MEYWGEIWEVFGRMVSPVLGAHWSLVDTTSEHLKIKENRKRGRDLVLFRSSSSELLSPRRSFYRKNGKKQRWFLDVVVLGYFRVGLLA